MEGQEEKEVLNTEAEKEGLPLDARNEAPGFRPIVVFYPDGKCMNAELGDNLLELARSVGVSIDNSCGGRGVCGKCKLLVRYGEVETRPTAELTEEEIENGYVLACQSKVIGDVVVEVPVSSQLGELQILKTVTGSVIGIETLSPITQRIDVSLIPPSLDDNSGDLERISRGIRDQLQEGDLHDQVRDGKLHADLNVLRKLPKLLRNEDWRVSVTITDIRVIPEVIDVQPVSEFRHNYGLAIDIGTTTIVADLLDLDTGSSVAVQSEYNGQIKYGDDVIARIIYSDQNENGLEDLRRAVAGTIKSLISDMVESTRISSADIQCAVCAGNATMIHLFLGIDPASIRREPYIAALQRVPIMRADELDIDINPGAPVYCFPSVGVYVGGDITSGVLATGMADSTSLSMLIDVGTNGEIVLGNNEWLMCCSCSAGPAFEGCGIKYGTHAVAGAIEDLEYHPDTDEVIFNTIGGKMPPRGICGSGLIDAMATLLRAGVIDRAGKINLSWQSPRVRVVDDEPQFVFVWGREVGLEDDISLNEADIQNLMRSKSAVYAGARLLLQSVGLNFSELELIRIAGGFGNYLNIENAVMIGLLPDIPLDLIQFVGNTSAAGARMALLSEEARQKSRDIFRRMTYLELMATGSKFMTEFIAALFLPHTDMTLFPSVKELLE